MEKTPQILLIENRLKQCTVFQLNFNVYLGANVTLVSKDDEFEALEPEQIKTFDLVITRDKFGENDILSKVQDALDGPCIVLNDIAESTDGIYYLKEQSSIQDVLKTAARVLDITPELMVQKEVPEKFPIPSVLLRFLIYAPCDIYIKRDESIEKVIEKEEILDDQRRNELLNESNLFYVDAAQRLIFTNSFTGQLLELAAKLHSIDLDPGERMKLMDQSLSLLADQFQKSGMDEEVIELVKSMAESMINLVGNFPAIGGLTDKMLSERLSYRYIHTQMVAYIGLHILKHMDWWIAEQKEAFAMAAFFHDLLLPADEETKVHSEEDFEEMKLSEEARNRVMNHANMTAKLVMRIKDLPEMTAKVIKEHHGSPNGIGFHGDPFEISNLSKAFLIAEEWAGFLIEYMSNDQFEEIRDRMLEHLIMNFNDDIYMQAISTLKYLDEKEFELALKREDEETTIQDDEVDELIENSDVFNDEAKENWKFLKFYGEKFANVLNSTKKESLKPGTIKVIEEADQNIQTIKVSAKNESEEVVSEKINGAVTFIEDNASEIKEGTKEEVDRTKKGVKTDIMKAAQIGNLKLVTHFLDDEENVQDRDAEGKTGLHYAAMSGKLDVIDFFVEKGVNKNQVDSHRRTPIYFTVQKGHVEAFKHLKDMGCRTDHQTISGITLPMLAAYKGNFEIINMLAEEGFRIDAKDFKDRDIFYYAMQGKNPDIIKLLHTMKKEQES